MTNETFQKVTAIRGMNDILPADSGQWERLESLVREWLRSYHWPGNVRELEHAILRATVKALSAGQPRDAVLELTAQHLGAELDAAPGA